MFTTFGKKENSKTEKIWYNEEIMVGIAEETRMVGRENGGAKASLLGQAMVEFIVALFAAVLIIAGMCDFIAMATRQLRQTERLRGKAGEAALTANSGDVKELTQDGEMPAAITDIAKVSGNLIERSEEEEIELSHAMKEWLYSGKRDSINVKSEIYMPPLKIDMGETLGLTE